MQVVGYISIAFPLGLLSRMFLGSKRHWQALAAAPAAALPKLLVAGSHDQFTSLATYTDVVQQLRGQQLQQQSVSGMDVKIMDGCDHFFVGHAKKVGDWMVQWVGQREQDRLGQGH